MFISLSKCFAKFGAFHFGIRLTKKNAVWLSIVMIFVWMLQLTWYTLLLCFWMVYSILVFLYMGWRISELLGLKSSDVDLEQGTIKGGTKTKNGKNRIVPIHPKILPFIRHRLQEDNEYLFSYNGKKMSATQYYSFWNALMDELQFEHTPHECRHTFRSRLDSSSANKVCIDLLMGHKSKEVGERVYTHKTIQELTDTINLLT